MSLLINYNPVVGHLIPTGTKAVDTNAALTAAKEQVGDAAWKLGNSGYAKDGATQVAIQKLVAAGILREVEDEAAPTGVRIEGFNVTGALKKVTYAETRDGSGNVYETVRVNIGEGDSGFVLSQEISHEFAQRLIQKLDQCQPGQIITIIGFASPQERGGRTYYNHVASVKSDGEEVKAAPGLWDKAQEAANAAAATLQSVGIKDEKVIKQAKASKKAEFHKEMLMAVVARFEQAATAPAQTVPAPTTTEAAPAAQAPTKTKRPLLEQLKTRITKAKLVLADEAAPLEQLSAANEELEKLVAFGKQNLASPADVAALEDFAAAA